MDITPQMMALITALALFAISWGGIHMVRAGIDYMASRGNPRNRDQANQSVVDIAKGIGLAGIGVALVTFMARTLVA